MSDDLLRGAVFPLPDDLQPDGTVCVRVVIPDDPQYLAMLVGLLDALKWSRNYARDATGNAAAIVSRTWESALQLEPVVMFDCEEGVPVFRIDPNTCLLEVLCGDTWQPVVTQGGYDPRDTGDPIIPFPDPPTEFSGKCSAAQSVSIVVYDEAIRLANDLINGLAFGQIVANFLSGVVSILVQIGMDFAYPQLRQMYAGISVVELQQDAPNFNTGWLLNRLNCYYSENGVITGDGYASLLDSIQDIIATTEENSTCNDPLDSNELWKIIHFVVLMLGRTGMQRAAVQTEHDIDSCYCYYTSVFDMRGGDAGWNADTGTWVIGDGWRTSGDILDVDFFPPETLEIQGYTFCFESNDPHPSELGTGTFTVTLYEGGTVVDEETGSLSSAGVTTGQGNIGNIGYDDFALVTRVRVRFDLNEGPYNEYHMYRFELRGQGIKPIALP